MTRRTAFLKHLSRPGGILIGVSLLTFVLLELVPGDAADLLLSSQMQTTSALGGIIAALFEKRLPDRGHRLFAILAVSMPDYWLGLMLLLLFALKLGWLPVLVMTCFFVLASGTMEIIHALLAPKNRLAAAESP